jgi:hypothetical protein
LPCGTVDPPVEKFTGNGSLGLAKDDITKAIHAFAHYSLVISENNLLFCDLQGMSHDLYNSYNLRKFVSDDSICKGTLDSMGVMCLIDPQAHT